MSCISGLGERAGGLWRTGGRKGKGFLDPERGWKRLAGSDDADLHRHPPGNDLVLDDDGTVVKIIIGSFSDRKGRWTREERMAAMRELRNGNCMRASA
jgi:hypothetical protein